jgi:hypothetical protein
VKGSSVSSTTWASVMGRPKTWEAKPATVSRRCKGVASRLATMVALVPTQTRSGAAHRSFKRRMSIATSAPWRPR